MKLSVIIPVLNERDSLPATIAALRACRGDSVSSSPHLSQTMASQTLASQAAVREIVISEIIISDGGSTDGTVEWVRAQPDLILVNSARGKGPQLNAGAARATADTLWFLHADSLVSQPALDALHSALSDVPQPAAQASTTPASTTRVSVAHTSTAQGFAKEIVGGAFYLRFAESRPRTLGFVSWGINLRARLRGSATGDQGIFVRRDVFNSIGGAPDWPLFEDVELVRRIRQAGKFVVLQTPITVSGRRYIQHGVLRTALLIYSLRLAYWLGVPPHRLKNWFRDTRGKQAPDS